MAIYTKKEITMKYVLILACCVMAQTQHWGSYKELTPRFSIVKADSNGFEVTYGVKYGETKVNTCTLLTEMNDAYKCFHKKGFILIDKANNTYLEVK